MQKDKVMRSVWNLVENIRDTTSRTVIDAATSGAIKIDKATLEKIVTLVNSSIESGYHKGSRELSKAIAAAETTNERQVEQPAKKSR